MKISIITAVYNRVETICRSLESVKAQDYSDIQHIVIDGLSNDGTIDQVKKCMPEGTVFVSEADRGVYDALNKGLNLADGEIVGFLHSDDVFAGSDVLTKVARQFEDSSVEAVYGDAVFFNSKVPEKIIRRYSSARFRASLLGWGWMPAHTTLFLRRGVYQKFGNFDISYRIAADYEFICRIFGSGELNSRYNPGGHGQDADRRSQHWRVPELDDSQSGSHARLPKQQYSDELAHDPIEISSQASGVYPEIVPALWPGARSFTAV